MSMHYGRKELERVLRLGAPLVMLDFLDVDKEAGRASGVKVSSIGESHFAGHFPGQPVLPGVLQTAGMVQASQVLFNEMFPGEDDIVLLGLKRVKFRSPVMPGMMLSVECELKGENEDGTVEFMVKNTCDDGKLASSGSVILGRRAGWHEPYDTTGSNPVSESVASAGSFLDSAAIMNILLHRYPFLFLDRSYGLDNPAHVVGFKNVAGSEMFVAATEHAEFMGYLQIEAGAQLGCAALLNQPAMQGKLGFFMSIDEAVFHRPVLAGSRIWMVVSCEQKGTFGIATGKFYVGSELVTEAQIKFAIVDKTN